LGHGRIGPLRLGLKAHCAVGLPELLLHVFDFLEFREFAAGIGRAPEAAIDHGQVVVDRRVKRFQLGGTFQERRGFFRLVHRDQSLCQAGGGVGVTRLQLERP
jgi:hypothetical protein